MRCQLQLSLKIGCQHAVIGARPVAVFAAAAAFNAAAGAVIRLSLLPVPAFNACCASGAV